MISCLNHSGVCMKGLKNISTSVSLTIQLGVSIRWVTKSLQVWTCIDWFCFTFEVTITLTEDSLLSTIWGSGSLPIRSQNKAYFWRELVPNHLRGGPPVILSFILFYFLHWNYIEMIFFFCFSFFPYIHFNLVQLLSCVRLFATLWIAARQASLFITNSWSLPKLMSIESVMPSNYSISVIPISYHPQSFPAAVSFQMSQLFASGGQSIQVSASTSVLPMNTQDWSPLGWTGWISLQSEELSRVFSNTTVQTHQFFSAQLSSQSSSHIHTRPLEKSQLWLDRP